MATNQNPYSPLLYTPSAIPSVEPIKVLAMILQEEMGLPVGQIMLGLENWQIPKNTGLYIALSYGPEQVVGNDNNNSVDSQGNFVEVQSAIMLHTIEIDVMSFDASAREEKEAVLWAIQSYEAQSLMDKYSMRIAAVSSSFVPIVSLEETKQLNRYRISVMVNAVHTNIKTTPYYDTINPVQLVADP